jgi:RNA polymerase sigma factor (sigma-70 family)
MNQSYFTDESSIRDVLTLYESKLIRYAWGITGSREQACDVVQDTFLKLCTTDRASLDGKLVPWLYTVCRNRAFDVRKKEGRMNVLEPNIAETRPSTAPSPGIIAEHNEDRAAFMAVLDNLPEDQQEIFKLKFEHGMTYREISSVMKMPLSSVSVTLTKALRTMRLRLRGNVNIAQEG